MSVPMMAIVVLCMSGFILTLVKSTMGREPAYVKGNEGGYGSRACKTIGSRQVQEDEYGVAESEDGTVAVLADKMGKQHGGKIASRIAMESFQDLFQDANTFCNPQYYFRKAFHRASQEILNQPDDGRGSTSMTAVLLKNRKLYFASVGDVKIAVYRNGDLIPATSGHTIQVLAKQKYMEGKPTRKEAVTMLHNHRLYNCVGQDDFHDVEFFDTPVSLYDGEYVVLMSDGLYEGTSWKSLENCLAMEGSCEKKALHMIELINQSEEKDKDNASVVLLCVD